MDTQRLRHTFQRLDRTLPHFPDGRIDYSNAGTALVIGIIAMRNNKLLLVKRSREVSFYPGKWNWPSGFIDEDKPLQVFAEQELREETGILPEHIRELFFASRADITDETLHKTWLIYPVAAILTSSMTPELDWEADDYAWVEPDDIESYDTVPGVTRNILAALEEYRAG